MTEQTQTIEADVEMIDQGDAPIATLGEDRLGRRRFAEALAAEVIAAPAARGYVMGLTGPWGSGKTSILNMTVDALGEDAIVVQFNPWMFSGTEALVSAFFEEIGRQLNKRDSMFKGIAQKLSTYGRLLSPVASFVGAGSLVGGAADMMGQLATRPSVFDERHELRSMLQKLDKRFVVIVDDVDRLREQEVLDIVRLVRLVGDFPNTVYLLAFDRGRVEECLGEGNLERGRAYLEKIVQVTHDVPAARQPDVTAIFLAGLQGLIEVVPTGPLTTGDWQNMFTFVVRPLLVTPRHVRRLLASLSMTLRLVGDEVALADLIGMEAIRVLQPAMLEAVVSVSDSLSAHSLLPGRGGYQSGRNVADSPVGPMFEVNPGLAEAICRWLFPAARRYFENMNHGAEWEAVWRRQRKIASGAVLRFYLERRLPEGVVPARVVDEALSLLGEPGQLRALLDARSPAELTDLIERMNQEFRQIAVDVDHMALDPARLALPVLLEVLDQMPDDSRPVGLSGPMIVMRAALRLLERITDPSLRTDVVRAVFADTRSRSGQLILLLLVGHRDNIGAGLVDAAVATELENQLRGELIAGSAEDFAVERQPVRLAELMVEIDEGRAALTSLAEDDAVMLSLFVGAVGETLSQAIGAAAVEVTKVLAWDRLAAWIGEETLIRRTAELLAAVQDGGFAISPEQGAALNLAADYATGNRPESSFDRISRMQAATETPPASVKEGPVGSPKAGDPDAP